jgi:3-deoxy-D-manno-octulosonic-acid transferase
VVQQLRGRLALNSAEAVVVAGSTHAGEETRILDALQAPLVGKQARLIIAVRHLERLEAVLRLCAARGLRACRAAQPTVDWQVLLVDSFGQLPLYYAMGDLALIGGSWIEHGGQNPLEAATLAKPVVFGPSMHNFPQISQALLESGGALQVPAGALRDALSHLLAQAGERAARGKAAAQCVQQHCGATQRVLAALQPFLDNRCR